MSNVDPLSLMLFAGNANLPLARSVAEHLQLPLGKAAVGRFSDGDVVRVPPFEAIELKIARLFFPEKRPT